MHSTCQAKSSQEGLWSDTDWVQIGRVGCFASADASCNTIDIDIVWNEEKEVRNLAFMFFPLLGADNLQDNNLTGSQSTWNSWKDLGVFTLPLLSLLRQGIPNIVSFTKSLAHNCNENFKYTKPLKGLSSSTQFGLGWPGFAHSVHYFAHHPEWLINAYV